MNSMYKEFTDKIIAYKLKDDNNALKVQTILKDYLIDYGVWKKGRDMFKEGFSFANGSAFHDVFVRNGLLNKLYEPIYEIISLSKEFMRELGFNTIRDDGVYGEAIDIRTNGMTIINWNREGHSCTYFGDKLESNINLEIKKDGGTRTVFCGYIFNENELKDILRMTW